MRVVVPSEIRPGEKRVALVPDVVSKLTKLGHEVIVQSGAGVHSQASDNEFTAAGAQVVNGDVLAGAEVVLSVSSLTPQQMSQLKRGAVTISFSRLLTVPIPSMPQLKLVLQPSRSSLCHASHVHNPWMRSHHRRSALVIAQHLLAQNSHLASFHF